MTKAGRRGRAPLSGAIEQSLVRLCGRASALRRTAGGLRPTGDSQRDWAIGAAAVAAVPCAWRAAADLQVVKPLFLPTLASVWDAFVTANTEAYRGYLLWQPAAISMQPIRIAFLVALTLLALSAIAAPLGMVVASSARWRAIVEPFMKSYRPLASLPYYRFGTRDSSEVPLARLGACAQIVARDGARGVRADRIDPARSLASIRASTSRYVVFPRSLRTHLHRQALQPRTPRTRLSAKAAEMVETGIGRLAAELAACCRPIRPHLRMSPRSAPSTAARSPGASVRPPSPDPAGECAAAADASPLGCGSSRS